MIFQPGRLCVKLAGRDAGRTAVVVEVINSQYVVIDGAVRRKKVNTRHLEPLDQLIDLQNKASPEEVVKAFQTLSLPVWQSKKKTAAAKPKRQKAKKEPLAEPKTTELTSEAKEQ